MPRKGENIYKRKDGRWEGRYIRSYDSEHKAKYAYVYGKTYSEVKRKLTEQRGNVQKVQPTKNKSSTYGELLDCWLHSMQLNTKESTQARYTHLIKTHIKPHLGAVQLSQLTTDAIEIFIEQQLTDGRLDNSGGLSPKTVTDILTIIKSTIEYARYKELPVICNLSKLSIKKKEKEMRVFTPSEQESLIGTLTNDMDHSKFGVLLSLYTGIRVKIINVSSRSFGTCAYDETDQLKLFNIIIKNAELPATGTNSFYPRQNNQQSVRFQVMECLASDEKVDPELGKEIGTAELTLPAGVTLDTEIQVTFRLDESGLLHLHAKEMKDGREVDAEFQTTEALSEQEMTDAIRRSNKSSVN